MAFYTKKIIKFIIKVMYSCFSYDRAATVSLLMFLMSITFNLPKDIKWY